MAEQEKKPETDPAGGAEGGMAEGGEGGPGQGNTLEDLSEETVREMENDGEDHAGGAG